MLLAIVVILFAAVVLMDYLPRLEKEGARAKGVYLSLLFVGFVIAVLYCLDIPVPSPTIWIRNLIDSFVKL